MSQFTDMLAQRPPLPKGPMCRMCAVMLHMPAEVLEDVQAALNNPAVQGSQITDTLNGMGYEVTAASVNRHRLGRCVPRG